MIGGYLSGSIGIVEVLFEKIEFLFDLRDSCYSSFCPIILILDIRMFNGPAGGVSCCSARDVGLNAD